MDTRKYIKITFCLLILSSNSVFALHQQALPPAYLSVDGFDACLSSKEIGSSSQYCLPNQKPEGCTTNAWSDLQKQNIHSCSA